MVTNKILENGSELMLIDHLLFAKPKRKFTEQALKITCFIVYYGAKLLL